MVKAYAYSPLLQSVRRGMLLNDVNQKDSTLEQFDNETIDEEVRRQMLLMLQMEVNSDKADNFQMVLPF